jgi:nucleoside-diphosphate-sugar epimerase
LAAAGHGLAQAVCRAAPHRALAIKRFPWLLVRILSPLVPVMREMLEMRYLWQVPLQLDASRLAQLIGPEPHTPLDEAVRASLQSLGCLTEAGSR